MRNEAQNAEKLFDELFPILRSITGEGIRKSLEIVKKFMPLRIESAKTGTKVLDWEVPKEWVIRGAKLIGPDGKVYADVDRSNLEVMNYSIAVDRKMPLEELKKNLFSIPELPNAIPYVTSYYADNWGFCIKHKVLKKMPKGIYHAKIDTEKIEGELNYGHFVLPGRSKKEILLTTYLCHPSLANDNLSGILALVELYNRIKNWNDRKYTYRFVVIPETIGSITYLQKYGRYLKANMISGIVLTCLGGNRKKLSYKLSRGEDSILDKLILSLKGKNKIEIRAFTPASGSDERQFCSPGFNLPVGQIARTPYLEFKEYHSSLDNKKYMNVKKVLDSADKIEEILKRLEYSGKYINLFPFGEPQLGRRGLYRSINSNKTRNQDKKMQDKIRWILSYSDGKHDMLDIANKMGCKIEELKETIKILLENGLIKEMD